MGTKSNKLRILAVHSINGTDYSRHSAIDMWRLFWPLEELKKHVDWTIDYQTTFLPDTYASIEQFDESELEKAAKHLGSYDIIISSYQPSPFVFALLKQVESRYGTKYVLDDDDDVYNIEDDNPFWLKSKPEDVYYMQRMIELASYITTTTDVLKQRYQERNPHAKVFTVPNYIPDVYKNDTKKDPERIMIGYFGGAGHYHDLHETGAIEAIQKLMHEHKNVHFMTTGVPIDTYLPTKRKQETEATGVHTWVYEVFPQLSLDIAIAPLRDTEFSKAKSNIKWQETTRLGAAFVASNVGPYACLPPHVLSRVENTPEAWYKALYKLVTDAQERQSLADSAKTELEQNWRLETHWHTLKEALEEVASVKS